MTRFVENLSFHENLNEFREGFSEFQLDEDFLRPVFLIFKSRKFAPEVKIFILQLVLKNMKTTLKFFILKFSHIISEILKNSWKIFLLRSKRKLYYLLTGRLRMIMLSSTRLKK